MRIGYHRIAYEALEVCNAVEMATVEAFLTRTGLQPGARALDIGCGNAGVSIRLAERFGLSVEAVELDPAMADLARTRIAASRDVDRIVLHQGRSADVLSRTQAFDLIAALGVTEPVGASVRDPEAMMAGLRRHLTPGGWLLWGDLTWISEPSVPVRTLAEMNNTYADDAGWRAAARAAGFEVFMAEISPPELWDRYVATMAEAVDGWLSAHPGHPDAASVSASAHRLKLMFEHGQDAMAFGLYLLKA